MCYAMRTNFLIQKELTYSALTSSQKTQNNKTQYDEDNKSATVIYLRVIGNLKFLAHSLSIDSRAKPLSLSWDMELQRKFLISLNIENDLSAAAAVTGTVIHMYAVQTSE